MIEGGNNPKQPRNVSWACEIQDPPILIVKWGPIKPIAYLYAPNRFVTCCLVSILYSKCIQQAYHVTIFL